MQETIITNLMEAGLDPSTAEIYMMLIERGEMSPKNMFPHTELSRATVHDALSELLAYDFVEYRKEGRQAYYMPVHPNKLHNLIEDKKRETKQFEQNMQETIRSLSGTFNLSQHKPGVRFFEGKEGLRVALGDTLTSQGTIYAYIDVDSVVDKNIDEMNQAYVKKRKELGKDKQLLINNSASAQEYMKKLGPKNTDTRMLPTYIDAFHTSLQIYDNKVLYVTLRKKNIISI
ncbi:hypothetical protein KKG82_04025, partial [Patescibacteria group bacterium]|nr:hypothetical protein [Patescibacteria group bacterium]